VANSWPFVGTRTTGGWLRIWPALPFLLYYPPVSFSITHHPPVLLVTAAVSWPAGLAVPRRE